MTREEAIKILANASIEPTWGGSFRATSEALKMAIEALKHERTDEWCTDCKEYDTEKKCCPRFNRVIRGAMKREMKNVTMDNPLTPQEIYDELFNFKESLKQLAGDFGELANGIMLSLAKTGSGEPSEDLISRKEAFEVLAEILDENHVPIWICDKMALAIDALPSADRPRGEWMYHEDYKLDGECCYECSNCGRMYDYKMNYCGYCGADMRGDTE